MSNINNERPTANMNLVSMRIVHVNYSIIRIVIKYKTGSGLEDGISHQIGHEVCNKDLLKYLRLTQYCAFKYT